MENQENTPPQKNQKNMMAAIGVTAVAVVAYLIMSKPHSSDRPVDNKKTEISQSEKETSEAKSSDEGKTKSESLAASSIAMSGKFNEEQTKQIEEVVLELVKSKSDVFMKAMQEGMQKQQEKDRDEKVKAASVLKDEFEKNAVTFGPKSATLKLFAFIDLSCPHCHNLVKIASDLSKKTKMVQFHFVIGSLLNPEPSENLANAVYTARLQDGDKAAQFLLGLVDEKQGSDKASFLLLADKVGLDSKKFGTDFDKGTAKSVINSNNTVVQKLIDGFPTIFAQNSDGKLVNVPPSRPEGYLELAIRVKKGEDITQSPKMTQEELDKEIKAINNTSDSTPTKKSEKDTKSSKAEEKKDDVKSEDKKDSAKD
ncbi:MAG: hypothetical protein C0432_04135 [Candidatus Puniceispirillum sp.]|nr:hypothetical protein [Candidatus Pelagibacter sp.]MBA4283464.1 hypothetical protein [Candidatus Puniceispirillum sp.]